MSDDRSGVATAAPADEAAQLRAQLAAANARAEAEARRAEALEGQVTQGTRQLAHAQTTGYAAQETAADNALASIKVEIDSLKAKQAELYAEGKFVEAADVGEQIGDAAARRREQMSLKTYYAGQKEQAQQTPADPVDRFLAERSDRFTEEEQAWIRRNRRYATDPEFQGRVNQAHNEAIQAGHERGSPAYFSHLERRGYMRPDPVQQHQQRQDGGGTQQQAAAATGQDDNQSPFSDTGGGEDTNQVFIEEPQLPPPVIPEGARAEQPQPRAAGTSGSMAAAPTRRSLSGSRAVQERRTMTPEEADMAYRFAQHVAPDVASKGMADVALWWDTWKRSKRTQEIRSGWEN